MAFFSSFRSPVCVFLLIRVIDKTMLRTFHRLCTESFSKLSNHRYFSRLHNDIKNRLNTGEGNWFFKFLMLPKNDRMKFKEHWNLLALDTIRLTFPKCLNVSKLQINSKKIIIPYSKYIKILKLQDRNTKYFQFSLFTLSSAVGFTTSFKFPCRFKSCLQRVGDS